VCFIATKSQTRAVRESDQIVFFKVVTKDRRSAVRQSDPIYYEPGAKIRANNLLRGELTQIRRGLFADPRWRSRIDRRRIRSTRRMDAGIYVFLNARDAMRSRHGSDRVIAVFADPKDCIGAGMSGTVAVACFTRIRVP
jgi:hypothetical protein